MTFDKIVYRETGSGGPGIRLTVDFGIGEIAVYSSGGEVMWRRLAGPCMSVLRMKTAACHFEAWNSGVSAPDGDSAGWSLALSREGKTVKQMNGGGALPEHRAAFASLVDLCFSLVENRSKRHAIPVFPDGRLAASF